MVEVDSNNRICYSFWCRVEFYIAVVTEALRDFYIQWLGKLQDVVDANELYGRLIAENAKNLRIMQAQLKRLFDHKVLFLFFVYKYCNLIFHNDKVLLVLITCD